MYRCAMTTRDRPAARRHAADTRLLVEALREHGRLAPDRLRVMLAWACEDAELARAAGDATREAMKRARRAAGTGREAAGRRRGGQSDLMVLEWKEWMTKVCMLGRTIRARTRPR